MSVVPAVLDWLPPLNRRMISSMSTYYVNKGRKTWRVFESVFIEGVRKDRQVPKDAYPLLSINPSWSLEEVRSYVKTLNAQNSVVRLENQAKSRSADRAVRLYKVNSAFLPANRVQEYEERLKIQYRSPQALKTQLSRWATAQKLVEGLRLKVDQAYFRRQEVYRWFIQRASSLDTTMKVISQVNKWGEFNNQHYIKIPTPDKITRNEIHEAYQSSITYRGSSGTLTPEMLEKAQESLKPDQYNWLWISIWLGLRPEEIDAKKFKLGVTGKTQFVSVYQSKLVKLTPKDRWKHIPLLYPQQKIAINLWENIKRPLRKTLHRVFGNTIHLYGGRKGFHSLMSPKHSDDVIATWLGHQSLDTLREHYIDRAKVRL